MSEQEALEIRERERAQDAIKRVAELEAEKNQLLVERTTMASQVEEAERAREDVARRLADATAEIGRLRQAMKNTIGAMRLEADQLERDLDDSRPV